LLVQGTTLPPSAGKHLTTAQTEPRSKGDQLNSYRRWARDQPRCCHTPGSPHWLQAMLARWAAGLEVQQASSSSAPTRSPMDALTGTSTSPEARIRAVHSHGFPSAFLFQALRTFRRAAGKMLLRCDCQALFVNRVPKGNSGGSQCLPPTSSTQCYPETKSHKG